MNGSTGKEQARRASMLGFLGALLASFCPATEQAHFNPHRMRGRNYPKHTFICARRRKLKGYQKSR